MRKNRKMTLQEELKILNNPEILRKLLIGLKHAAEGRLKNLGNFRKYLEEYD